MGWATWCTSGRCCQDVCNNAEIRSVAAAMVESGLLAAGWNHIHLDDCWALDSRDAQGRLQWDPTRFPEGLPPLIEWLHAQGFTFGIYTSLGPTTCNQSGEIGRLLL